MFRCLVHFCWSQLLACSCQGFHTWLCNHTGQCGSASLLCHWSLAHTSQNWLHRACGETGILTHSIISPPNTRNPFVCSYTLNWFITPNMWSFGKQVSKFMWTLFHNVTARTVMAMMSWRAAPAQLSQFCGRSQISLRSTTWMEYLLQVCESSDWYALSLQ